MSDESFLEGLARAYSPEESPSADAVMRGVVGLRRARRRRIIALAGVAAALLVAGMWATTRPVHGDVQPPVADVESHTEPLQELIGADRPTAPEPAPSRASGAVVDLRGRPVSSARVRLGVASTWSSADEAGRFEVEGVGGAIEVVAAGYGTGHAAVGQRLTVTLLAADAVEEIGPGPAQIDLPAVRVLLPEALTLMSGELPTYPVRATITTLRSSKELPGAPAPLATEEHALESFGMVDVRLEDAAGLEVVLGAPAVLELEPVSGHPYQSGEAVALYHYDALAGRWAQEGQGRLDGGRVRMTVAHFSWWNLDVPRGADACVDGVVNGPDGPWDQVWVEVIAQGGLMRSGGPTNAAGAFGVSVVPGTHVVSARVTEGGCAVVSEAVTVSANEDCAVVVLEHPGEGCASNPGRRADVPPVLTRIKIARIGTRPSSDEEEALVDRLEVVGGVLGEYVYDADLPGQTYDPYGRHWAAGRGRSYRVRGDDGEPRKGVGLVRPTVRRSRVRTDLGTAVEWSDGLLEVVPPIRWRVHTQLRSIPWSCEERSGRARVVNGTTEIVAPAGTDCIIGRSGVFSAPPVTVELECHGRGGGVECVMPGALDVRPSGQE